MLAPVREVMLRLITLATSQKTAIGELTAQAVVLAQDKANLATQLATELSNNPAEQAAIVAAQTAAGVALTDLGVAQAALTSFQTQAASEVETLRAEITQLLDQLANAASGGNAA